MLRPYIEGRGGVVHVRYRGNACAPNAFLQTIKSAYENLTSDGPRASVRIDEDNFKTHYLGDVLQSIAKKVGCTLEAAVGGPPVIGEITIASGNEAKGDMDVNAENIHVHVSDGSDGPLLRERRVGTLNKATQDYLSSGRLMIVLNDAPPNVHAMFWRDLWDGGLKDLTKEGLLLVKMTDEERQHQGNHPDEPQAEQVISLPVEFDEARQRDAVEDLAMILIREVKKIKNIDLSLEAATANIRAFVVSHKRSISRLHDEWSGVLMELVRHAN